MSTGLKVAVGVNKSGGAATENSVDQLDKIIRLALSAGEDDNPFQNLGLSENLIFSPNDPATRSVVRNQVRSILSKFSDRMRVDPNFPIIVKQSDENEMELSFKFFDLENNELKVFSMSLGRV